MFDERTQKLRDSLAKILTTGGPVVPVMDKRMFIRSQILKDPWCEPMPSFRYNEFSAWPDERVAKVLRGDARTWRAKTKKSIEVQTELVEARRPVYNKTWVVHRQLHWKNESVIAATHAPNN